MDSKHRKKIKKKSSIHNLQGLIELTNQDPSNYPSHINMRMLLNIRPQLLELNNMIGMNQLKQTIFYQIIYYLQDLCIEDEHDFLHTVIIGPPGSGKCLGENTPILMFDGSIKKVQHIETNDILMGDDNNPRIVKSITSGEDECYEISRPFKYPYIVNKSHILSLCSYDKSSQIDVNIETYLTNLKDYQDYHGYTISVNIPTNYDLSVNPYILGYCLTSKNPCLVYISNSTVFNYFSSVLYDKITLENGFNYEINSDYFNSVHDIIFDHDFSNLFQTSSFILRQVLAGIRDAIFMDTDLTIEHNYLSTLIYFLCNLLGIDYIVDIQSINITIGNNNKSCEIHYIKLINLNQNLPSFIYDYDQFNEDDLTTNQIINLHPISIKPVGIQKYYGFELSGNGRFLLSDCTVTHNTTIAQIIGEMYRNMGILSGDGIFKIAKREDFIAEYLGQTSIKTKKLLQSCLGGVLFIDEVYALGPGKGDKDSFSKEAIDTLNVFLSEHSDEFCCIIAGYENDIQNCFFNVNQGLERRFQWIHRIESYTIEDLSDMFLKLIYEIRWKTNISRDKLIELLDKNKNLIVFSGGDIQNLVTKCKIAHAQRLLNCNDAIKHLITEEDIIMGIEFIKSNQVIEEDDKTYVNSMYI